MNKIFTFLFAYLLTTGILAQSPNKMSYQSVVRDAKGNLAKDITIGMKISILQGDVDGTVVYAETQSPVTNANGLATLVIGEGNVVTGSFSTIDWSNGPYFIKTETDISGGTNYTITGTSQLLSVPYAMHATTAESLTNPDEESDPVFSSWDKSSGIAISESQVTDLKHFTNADEADPQYSADSAFIKAGTRGWNSSLAKTIGTEDTTRWGKTFTETDPLFTAWDKSTGVAISESQITDLKHFTNDDETDPLFIQSTASGITPSDTARWNDKSSFSGNYHDLTNKPTGLSDFTNDMDYVQSYELNKYLTAESDPKYASDSSFIKTGVRSWNHSLAKKINTADTTRWGKAETDPLFSGSQAANLTATDIIHLGNLSGTNTGDQDLSGLTTKAALSDTAAYLRSEIPDVSGFLSTETDPIFTGSQAANITATDIANLSNLSGINTGNQDLSGLATKTALGDTAAHLRSEIPDVSGFLSTETDPIFTGSQAANITGTDITNLSNLSGINTGNQDLSGLATKTALGDTAALLRSEIPDVSGFLSTETDPVYSGSQAANITATDITNLANLSGTNTGDQDLSGLATKTALGDTAALLRSEIPDISGLATTISVTTALDAKVDKVAGKGLSTNDYTTTEQTKLAGIEEGAQVNVNADWDATSGDAQILNKPTIPSEADGSETKVTAGTNVTVTGAGTTASPYVVNALVSMTIEQRDALTATEGMVVYNTTTHKPNYYNGTEWMNYDGTSAKVFAIGDSYQGGIIAYILQDGDPGYVSGEIHGIIAAPTDQSDEYPWTYDFIFEPTGATGTALGTGLLNTTKIAIFLGGGGYAAQECFDMVLGGYSDWYLPSKDELNILYLNKTTIGNFGNSFYWSSTEVDGSYAWIQSFDDGNQYSFGKDFYSNAHVRAIRYF